MAGGDGSGPLLHHFPFSRHFSVPPRRRLNRMKAESFLPSRPVVSFRRTLKCAVLRLWDVYSSPAPSGGDVGVLLGLCLSLSVLTGGLLYHWLSNTLGYAGEASSWVSSVYGVLVLLATFLCHPLRCVLTMTLPTVCTKQGRKLLLSASVMVLILNVIPNIALNVGAVAKILKCTAEGFTRSLLNSSAPLNRAKQDLVEEIRRAKVWSNVNHLETLDHLTNVDVSQVKVRMKEMIGQIEANFSHATGRLKGGLLIANRILAAAFVALLVLEASRYLNSYLSSVRFGNASKERRRRDLTPGGGGGPWPSILPPSCRIRSHECSSCILALLAVTFYFLVIALIVGLDHVVYGVVDLIIPWLLDLPSTSAMFDVSYKLKGFPPILCIIPQSCTTQELVNFHRPYTWTYDPEPSLCEAVTSAPSRGVAVLLGCLCLMSYLLAFVEVYAKRLCRNICASFFREQEEKRAEYLRRKEQKVFSVTLGDAST